MRLSNRVLGYSFAVLIGVSLGVVSAVKENIRLDYAGYGKVWFEPLKAAVEVIPNLLVECIGKGKARTPYEFGCKVSVATPATKPKGGQFVLHAKALHGFGASFGHGRFSVRCASTLSGRVSQNIAATPHRLDVMASAGCLCQLLPQLTDEDIDDFFAPVHARRHKFG